MLLYYEKKNEKSVALVYGKADGREEITYGQLAREVEKRAEQLKQTKKSCIGIFCSTDKDCVVTVFAAAKIKMQIVMLDANVPSELIKKQIAATDVDMLWSEDSELVSEFEPYLTDGVDEPDGKILFFTSGTTSSSKAVILTEKSLCSSAYNGSAKLPLSEDDTLMCILPLAHVFGFVCGLLWGLSCGSAVALSRGARYITEDFKFFKPTAASLVPMLLGFFLKGKLFNEELRLVLIGAGDCHDSLINAARALGIRVSFGYGLTETSSGVAISVSGDLHAMEICPDDEIMIAPDGEILIKAPTCIMQGYYKNKESTDEAIKDGVLHSGDLGFIDMDGKLHITGRKKEMLVLPSGNKIFLPDYEHTIAKALENEEIAVILLNAQPTLVIKELEHKREEIRKKLTEVMKSFPRAQQITDILFTDKPLPRTATGKIKRWEIQKTEEEKK